MYKVFFNDQVLLLLSEENKPLTKPFITINTEEEIPSVIQEFIQKESSIVLIYKDVDILFGWIKKQFKYLEAAGGIVKNNYEEILFIYRLQQWDLPKGKIEANETAEDAAYREIEEECGIKHHQLKKSITSSFHIYKRDGIMHLKKTFWFLFIDTEDEILKPQIEENIERVVWLDNNEISLALRDSYLSINEVYADYQKMTN